MWEIPNWRQNEPKGVRLSSWNLLEVVMKDEVEVSEGPVKHMHFRPSEHVFDTGSLLVIKKETEKRTEREGAKWGRNHKC